jgi:hypothetical protein
MNTRDAVRAARTTGGETMTTTEHVDPATGELLPALADRRLTPQEAKRRAEWVREMKRAVLVEGVDYGLIPGTPKPVLWKPGAEMLLLAAGFGFTMTRVDDDESRDHQGVTYRCTVLRDGAPAAVCDGYCGTDDPNHGRSPWNTILKMAQKRALVGATLNACAASGLFAADRDDDADRKPAQARKAGGRFSPADSTVLGEWFAALSPPLQHRVTVAARRNDLPDGGPVTVADRDRLAWLILSNIPERRRPEPNPDAWNGVDTDPIPADAHDDDTTPEAVGHDATRYDPDDGAA